MERHTHFKRTINFGTNTKNSYDEMNFLGSVYKRLRIYIGETGHYKGRALYQVIVAKAKKLDLAGATVFRGLMGYGANSRIHTAKFLDLSSDLPMLVEIVDSEEYISKLPPALMK